MALHIGSVAPDFTQESTEGPIHFHEWIGDKWAILFSHPKDFTPVCTTELGTVAKLKGEFDKRNIKPIGVSVDDVTSHKKWVGDIEETQHTKMNFPILGDGDKKVAKLYDMIHPEWNDTLTVRSVFVVDNNKKIRLMITYPASTGRNFQEILRAIDSLQLTDKYQSRRRPTGRMAGLHHRAGAAGRESAERKISERLQGSEAVPAHHARSKQVAHRQNNRKEKSGSPRQGEPLCFFTKVQGLALPKEA